MWCGTKRKYKSFRLGSEKFCNFSCLREEVQFPLDRTGSIKFYCTISKVGFQATKLG
jgi:hypothetical protein